MKTGTREWSENSANCMIGACPHKCRYCYAPEWYRRWNRPFPEIEQLNPAAKAKRYDGVVMFPTRHDITPENLQYTLPFLEQLLQLGNRVLVVSKPHFSCVVEMCRLVERLDARDRVEFRFTIGTTERMQMLFWEPGAPCFGERMDCLLHTAKNGFNTSVSAEPLLTPWSARWLYDTVAPYAETVWIGAMNKIETRVHIEEGKWGELELLEEWQTSESMRKVYESLKGCDKVRWKDSYQKALGLSGPKTPTPSRCRFCNHITPSEHEIGCIMPRQNVGGPRG